MGHRQRRFDPTRRRMLGGLLGTGFVVSGCDGIALRNDEPFANQRGRAALLLPLSGRQAELGAVLRKAATLGGTTLGQSTEIEVLDAGGDPASAVRAAEAGVAAGAQMVLGPLFADQARAVVKALPRIVPVVALSNDDTLAAEGAFVYGVTPRHSAQAIGRFVARQKMARLGVMAPPGAFGDRAVAGFTSLRGIEVLPPVRGTDAAALRAAFADSPPDAIYLPSAGPELAELAVTAKALGAQVMGSAQWSALDFAGRNELDEAWYAAPDPLRFAPFSSALASEGALAGIVAGLVFDAVEMARLLGRLGQQDRRGLLRDKGFSGVLGPYRFERSGQAIRDLAVLGIKEGAVTVLGAPGA